MLMGHHKVAQENVELGNSEVEHIVEAAVPVARSSDMFASFGSKPKPKSKPAPAPATNDMFA